MSLSMTEDFISDLITSLLLDTIQLHPLLERN